MDEVEFAVQAADGVAVFLNGYECPLADNFLNPEQHARKAVEHGTQILILAIKYN